MVDRTILLAPAVLFPLTDLTSWSALSSMLLNHLFVDNACSHFWSSSASLSLRVMCTRPLCI